MTPKRLDAKSLNDLLRYDPTTGKLFWRPRSIHHFKTERSGKTWNTRYAGKEAFTAMQYGYKVGKIHGKTYQAHRVIWCMMTGEWPEHTDHINGVRDDNRRGNLREVAHIDNMRNMKKARNNTSGHTGVHFSKRHGKWRALIGSGGKQEHLGYFESLESAIAARKQAERDHGYHENHGR